MLEVETDLQEREQVSTASRPAHQACVTLLRCRGAQSTPRPLPPQDSGARGRSGPEQPVQCQKNSVDTAVNVPVASKRLFQVTGRPEGAGPFPDRVLSEGKRRDGFKPVHILSDILSKGRVNNASPLERGLG